MDGARIPAGGKRNPDPGQAGAAAGRAARRLIAPSCPRPPNSWPNAASAECPWKRSPPGPGWARRPSTGAGRRGAPWRSTRSWPSSRSSSRSRHRDLPGDLLTALRGWIRSVTVRRPGRMLSGLVAEAQRILRWPPPGGSRSSSRCGPQHDPGGPGGQPRRDPGRHRPRRGARPVVRRGLPPPAAGPPPADRPVRAQVVDLIVAGVCAVTAGPDTLRSIRRSKGADHGRRPHRSRSAGAHRRCQRRRPGGFLRRADPRRDDVG